jgi:proteasome lid subunit RPN8/RPN11
VCGLIAARDGAATRTLVIPNIATQPECRYRMDPAVLVRSLYDIESRGESLFAIYHSHPRGPSSPSSIDVAEAEYPQAIYLIVSLDTQGVLEMRAFRIRNGAAAEIELEIESG